MISFTNLFTLLGHIIKVVQNNNTYATGSFTTATGNIATSLESLGILTQINTLGNSITNFNSNIASYSSQLISIAQNAIISTINADTPQPNLSFSTAWNELVLQMIADGQSVGKSTVSNSY